MRHELTTIRYNHVESGDRPSNDSTDRQAARKASCSASLALSSSRRMRRATVRKRSGLLLARAARAASPRPKCRGTRAPAGRDLRPAGDRRPSPFTERALSAIVIGERCLGRTRRQEATRVPRPSRTQLAAIAREPRRLFRTPRTPA
jgi:hypothetical protein